MEANIWIIIIITTTTTTYIYLKKTIIKKNVGTVKVHIFIQTVISKTKDFSFTIYRHVLFTVQSLKTETKALLLLLTAALAQLGHLLDTPLKQNWIRKIFIRDTKHDISQHNTLKRIPLKMAQPKSKMILTGVLLDPLQGVHVCVEDFADLLELKR